MTLKCNPKEVREIACAAQSLRVVVGWVRSPQLVDRLILIVFEAPMELESPYCIEVPIFLPHFLAEVRNFLA